MWLTCSAQWLGGFQTAAAVSEPQRWCLSYPSRQTGCPPLASRGNETASQRETYFPAERKKKENANYIKWQTLKYSAKRQINHVPEDHLKRPHSVIGEEKVPNSVAFTFLLPLQLNGHVPTNHHTVTRPILSTLLLQRVRKRQIYFILPHLSGFKTQQCFCC